MSDELLADTLGGWESRLLEILRKHDVLRGRALRSPFERMWRNRDTHRPQKPAVERP